MQDKCLYLQSSLQSLQCCLKADSQVHTDLLLRALEQADYINLQPILIFHNFSMAFNQVQIIFLDTQDSVVTSHCQHSEDTLPTYVIFCPQPGHLPQSIWRHQAKTSIRSHLSFTDKHPTGSCPRQTKLAYIVGPLPHLWSFLPFLLLFP